MCWFLSTFLVVNMWLAKTKSNVSTFLVVNIWLAKTKSNVSTFLVVNIWLAKTKSNGNIKSASNTSIVYYMIPKFLFHNWRSSHRSCSMEKGVRKNLTKFIGNYLCKKAFFSKFVSWGLKLYLKRGFGAVAFHWILWNFYEQFPYRTSLGDCFCNWIVNVILAIFTSLLILFSFFFCAPKME